MKIQILEETLRPRICKETRAVYIGPDPNSPSQGRRFFRVRSPVGSPHRLIIQLSSDWPLIISTNPFSRLP